MSALEPRELEQLWRAKVGNVSLSSAVSLEGLENMFLLLLALGGSGIPKLWQGCSGLPPSFLRCPL